MLYKNNDKFLLPSVDTPIYIFVFFALIFSFAKNTNAASENEILKEIENLINAQGIDIFMEQAVLNEQHAYPLKKDVIDTIVNVYYIRPSKNKVYTHMLNANWREYYSEANNLALEQVEILLQAKMKEITINTICSNKLNLVYLDNKVKITHLYRELDGTFIFELNVGEKDCN